MSDHSKKRQWKVEYNKAKTIDLFGVHFGCPNKPRIHFTYFINSLLNPMKVQYQVGNTVLEKIWHRKKIFIGFHCNFDWMN